MTLEEFYDRLLHRLGEMALVEVRPSIPSQTLQDNLKLEVSTSLVEPRAVLYLPYYWAVYVHDGRGPVVPVEKTWLVWFANPADDPRTSGGTNYPVRASDIRRLTPDEWAYGLRRNAEARARGEKPFMVVCKYAGPVKPPQSFAFFEDGLSTFSDRAAPVVAEEFEKYVRSLVKSKTDTARKTMRF